MSSDATLTLLPDAPGIARGAAILAQGGLVAFPTETVYGLGADAGNDRAVAAIYAAKGRPSFNPLIVHLADFEQVARYCEVSAVAEVLAAAFWPGPLTLVLPLKQGAGISRLVTAGLDTLALRIPAHPVARAVLRAFDGPIAAPSANLSGKISPTTAAHVLHGLRGRIDAVVDGGACRVGVESTIVGLDGAPKLYRAGGIASEDIEQVLGHALAVQVDVPETAPQSPTASPIAPGQLLSHYAPIGQVRLNVTKPDADEILLGFGPVEKARLNLSPSGDLLEAAARLFDCLHQLDTLGAQKIAVSPIPSTGLGLAINDRLRRAAAPRNGSF